MKREKRINQIFYKSVAAILLFITLFMYPVQSLAFAEFFRKNFRLEEKEEDDSKKSDNSNIAIGSRTAWAYPFDRLYNINAYFGPREPKYTLNGAVTGTFHYGIDFGAPDGTPILSVTAGVVIQIDKDKYKNYGFAVHIKRDDNYVAIFAHMNDTPLVDVGDQVQIGQIIGYVGDTGNSTGPHLHLEIKNPSGEAIDPIDEKNPLIDITTPGISSGMGSSENNSLLLKDFKRGINDGEFFYKGVPDGHFKASTKSIFKWIVEFLAEIADYLLGLLTAGAKFGFLGWAVLVEVLLTDALDSLVVKNVGTSNYRKSNMGFYTDSKRTVNVENIFFNRVEALNVNFFESKESVKKRLLKYSPSGLELEELYGENRNLDDSNIAAEGIVDNEADADIPGMENLEDGPLLVIKDYFAEIFMLIYALSIFLLLGALILNAILASVESVGIKKATYKQRAKDWLKALIEMSLVLIFMITILQFHTWVIDFMSNIADNISETMGGEYINTDMGRNYTIMETLRTRAASMKFSVGIPATVMYIVLIWYTVKFFLVYVKRFLVIFFLSVLGPILMVYDLIMKTIKGKSEVRTDWLKEYTFNVLIQVVHVFIYIIFIPMIYSLASTSIIGFLMMFLLFRFLLESEQIIRQIFNIRGAKRHSILDNVTGKSSFRDYMSGVAVGSFVGTKSLPGKQLKKHAGQLIKPITHIAGASASVVLRGTYNTIQSAGDARRKRRSEAGLDEKTDRQKKRIAKKEKELENVLRLQGYSDEEIQDRIKPDGKLAYSEELKDRIRLLEVSKTRKVNPIIRGVNKAKYTTNRFKRVLDNMADVDDKGKKRLKSGKYEYSYEDGKIVFKDGVKDKFKKAVVKEFNMGKGKLGEKEFDKTIADFKKAGSLGAKTFFATALFPVALADPSISEILPLGLAGNFQFNSKTLGSKRGRSGSAPIISSTRGVKVQGNRRISNQNSRRALTQRGTGPLNLKYGSKRQRRVSNRTYKRNNQKKYDMIRRDED